MISFMEKEQYIFYGRQIYHGNWRNLSMTVWMSEYSTIDRSTVEGPHRHDYNDVIRFFIECISIDIFSVYCISHLRSERKLHN